ncbi:MAG: extracellular solute-binding protein [Hungatella sp.]|nr:extracellular solute-binding protein [Hungatella sp.]
MKRNLRRSAAAVLAGGMILSAAACVPKVPANKNLISRQEENGRVVTMFGPTDRSNPDAMNAARTAQEQTVIMAEKQLELTVQFRTYTAEDYKDRTYDEVCLDRVRSNMDDMYLLNPDAIQALGEEGQLADLSGLDSVKNLRDVVKTANMVDGKLVAIPQEIVVYGLFINQDMFDRYGLEVPETPEELLDCCRVFQENGIETPIGANRWWLENFVLAIGYADLYNGGDTDRKIAALNSGEEKLSDYMRPGFEYLQEMIDRGYIDAAKAYTYEAIDGEGPDFLAQKTPIVMAYWGAANAETAYGKPEFNMTVIGFPSSRGQMPVVSLSGYGISDNAEHMEDAMATLNLMISDEALRVYSETNKVISPSKNVETECIDALKPLKNKINENIYVLGSNANMKVEQWGNICLIVRDLLNGSSVDACMEKFDRLQEEILAK